MNRVVKILMERDGLTDEEAKSELEMNREELYEAIHDGEDTEYVEDLFSELFGLEPDYIFDVL